MTRKTRLWASESIVFITSSSKNTERSLFLRWEVQEGDSRGRTELLAADQRWGWASRAAGKPRPFPPNCRIKTRPLRVRSNVRGNSSSRPVRITSVVQTALRLMVPFLHQLWGEIQAPFQPICWLKSVKLLLWKWRFVADVRASPNEFMWISGCAWRRRIIELDLLPPF